MNFASSGSKSYSTFCNHSSCESSACVSNRKGGVSAFVTDVRLRPDKGLRWNLFIVTRNHFDIRCGNSNLFWLNSTQEIAWSLPECVLPVKTLRQQQLKTKYLFIFSLHTSWHHRKWSSHNASCFYLFIVYSFQIMGILRFTSIGRGLKERPFIIFMWRSFRLPKVKMEDY